MPRFVALVAGVNVGGTGKVPMAELRSEAEALGLGRPRTLLASGNLVFDAPASAGELELRLEELLRSRFGLAREVMVRSRDDWRAALAANALPAEAQAAPSRFFLFALEREAAPDAQARLAQVVRAPEQVAVNGRHAYGWFPEGVGRAATDLKQVDRALGCRTTARNWNTAQKLAAMLDD